MKEKNPHAAAMGKLGGPARAAALTSERKKEIAAQGAAARWGTPESRGVPNPCAVGQRRGKLTLIEATRAPNSRGHMLAAWVCQCDCGVTRTIPEAKLVHRGQLSCGCARKEFSGRRSPELKAKVAAAMAAGRAAKHVPAAHKLSAGDRFGRLVLVEPDKRQMSDRLGLVWVCMCDCGNTHVVAENNLVGGSVSSCGCLRRELNASAGGEAKAGEVTPEHNTWIGIKSRCNNPNIPAYREYGAKGIKVCDRWNDPATGYRAFLEDMGRRPSDKHSLDRIDGTKGYSPENCRWATDAQQARNRRTTILITHEGRTQCALDWAREKGIAYKRLIEMHRLGTFGQAAR